MWKYKTLSNFYTRAREDRQKRPKPRLGLVENDAEGEDRDKENDAVGKDFSLVRAESRWIAKQCAHLPPEVQIDAMNAAAVGPEEEEERGAQIGEQKN
ncbi:hypothetical protein GCM10027027_19670 [Neomicrococcus lactis]